MKQVWQVPEWMVPYIQHIQITGSFTVSELMNDTQTRREDDPAKHLRIISVRAQIKLLNKLHDVGIL